MTTPRPLLFRGKTQDLLTEIERDLRAHADLRWQGQKDGAGQAMVKLFGRFADIIVARLNQAPQQHFLAFLSEGGIDQLPPRAAATQLRFVPEDDARPIIPVPAGTQVTTRAVGQQLEIIFETTQDVQVIPTELTRCIAVDGLTYADQTGKANGIEAAPFAAFLGSTLRERVLYLRDDGLLAFPDQAVREHATITLRFVLQGSKASSEREWQLTWLYWDGKAWAALVDNGAQIDDGTQGFSCSGDVRLTNLPDITPTEVNGVKGAWIACQLAPISQRATLPQIRLIEISREIVVPEQVVAPQVFTVTQAGAAFAPVKPDDPFYPFGQFPALLDGLYIRADEALTKPGATVELRFEGNGLPPKLENTSVLEALKVLWEYSSKDGWIPLGTSRWGCPEMAFADRSNPLVKDIVARPGITRMLVEIELPQDYSSTEPPPGFPTGMLVRRIIKGGLVFAFDLPTPCAELPVPVIERGRSYTSERLDFRDTTYAFTAPGPGSVAFRVPACASDGPLFAPIEVNAQTGCWVRARIVEGGYSVPQSGPSGLLQRLLIGKIPPPPAMAVPPLIRELQCSYANYRPPIEGPKAVQGYLGKTDGGWHSPAADPAIKPFFRSVEDEALYLGFSPLDTEPANTKAAFPANVWGELYIGVEEPDDERAGSDLTWEYWSEKGWEDLDVVDETRGLRRSGAVGFFGPADHRPGIDFFRPRSLMPVRTVGETSDQQPGAVTDQQPGVEPDRRVYWLRVRPVGPNQDLPVPRLTVVRLNTASAVNGETISDEVLGSSDGRKNQKFRLSHAPVLPDVQIQVQVPVEESEGSDQTWITWERVPTLLPCDATSRCYVLDPTSGTITFGDNKHGMIPLAGQDNIRARRYRAHNGAAGDLAASTINVMRNPKDALNEIRRAANVEPATGGADLEETALIELRGPYTLKNRGRAITGEDFEWLAREVAGVRHVYCLPARKRDGTHEPGWVTAVVVPEHTHTLADANGRPIPTPALLRQVREYLEARGLINLAQPVADTGGGGAATTPALGPDQIQVTGPGFVEIQVIATVVARDPTRADSVRTAILKQLDAFLDPVAGGPDRKGWEPGRAVYISEVKAEIESVPGVDHVQHAFLCTPSRQQQFLTLDGEASLPFEMPIGSQVSTFDQRIKAVLVETLPKDIPLQQIPVACFNDGDLALISGLQGPIMPTMRRVSVQYDNPAEIIFDQPIGFGDAAEFARWWNELGDLPALISADGRVRAPIKRPISEPDDTGREHLLGVEVSTFVAGEPVSITHAEHLARRRDFLPVKEVSGAKELSRVFVPADHLVFSGNHDIEMAAEGKHARQAA